jgi:hypothetical protein
MQTEMNNHYRNGVDNGGNAPVLTGLHADFAPVPASAEPTVTPPADTQAHREHDLILRRRDRFGNRLGWFYHFNIPTIEDLPLEQTALGAAVAVVRESLPLRAADLAHFYDHKLRPAFRRLLAVRLEEETRLGEYNAGARRSQEEADTEQARLEEARDAATHPTHAAVIALDADLIAAHQEATAKVARTGGAYDPQNPSPACVLRHERRPLEVIAAEMALPWTHADARDMMSSRLAWGMTTLVGMLIGVSIGVMAGMLPADNLTDRPLLLAIFATLGLAPAWLGKYALRLSGRDAAQRYWLGRPWTNWAPSALLTFGIALVILLADSYVEREGLLANVRLREMVLHLSSGATGQSGGVNETTFFFAAILLSFPYIVLNLWEGYLCGRRDACQNRVRARQEQEFEQADRERRAEPDVQQALDAIVRALDLLRHKGMLLARVAETAAPFEQKITKAEASRLAEREALDEHARCRIQDALDNFLGAQAIFDRMFDEARQQCERPSGFGRNLWRSLFGYRPPRSNGSNPRRNTK